MSTLTNLIAYWRMDEASGKRYDSVGGFYLDSTGGVDGSQGTGKLGSGSFVKDGTKGLHGNGTKPADFSTNTLSIAGWLKLETLPTSGAINEVLYIDIWDEVDQYRTLTLYFDATDDHLVLNTMNNNTSGEDDLKASTFGAISAATWYHVALIWTGSNVEIHINDTKDSEGGHQNFASCLKINGINFGRNAAGSDEYTYDDFGLWDEAISATDISDLYNTGSGAIPPGLGTPDSSDSGVALFAFHGR